MQLVRVRVPNERRGDIYATLDEMGFDYFMTPGTDRFEETSIVEIPVSDEAVGDVTDALCGAGTDLDQYSVVHSLQWATTPNAGAIRKRYTDQYDRPSERELHSLVDELNWDRRSFLVLMALSGLIAAIGIVLDIPVIVIGSAVIAPFVNPMVITGIGAILGQRWMIQNSLRLQALGLVVATGSAFAVGVGTKTLALAPATLNPLTLGLFQTLLAPSPLIVLVGVAAGVAAVVSLTAESSLVNIVGVMIAAALMPAIAVTGVALAWGEHQIALGAALLLMATVIVVNLAILATFVLLGYRPSNELFAVPSRWAAVRVAAFVLVLGLVLVGTGAAFADQIAFERNANEALDEVMSDSEYEDLSTVGVRSAYAENSLFTGPTTIIVEVSRPDGNTYPELSDRIAAQVAAETGHVITVRVEFVDRQESS